MKPTLEDYFKNYELEVEETKFRSISYSRKFNLGNYESEEISVAADLEDLETLDQSVEQLKSQVMRIHEGLKTLESPKTAISVTRPPDKKIPWEFNPQEFLDYANWKNKKIGPREYTKGSISWGWEFIEDLETGQKNFSEAALKALDKGPVRIGDDYEITKTDRIVQTKRIKK